MTAVDDKWKRRWKKERGICNQSILDPVKVKGKKVKKGTKIIAGGGWGAGRSNTPVLCEWKFSLYISSGSNVTAIHSFKILQLLCFAQNQNS